MTKNLNRPIIVLVSSALCLCLLSGCGDDGRDGSAGPPGPAGTPGSPGPAGPPSGQGGIPIGENKQLVLEVRSVTIGSSNDEPVVEFNLTNDLRQGLTGLPAADVRFVLAQLTEADIGSGESSQWQSYVSRASGGIPNAQASTESGSAGTLTDNGDGSYQYRFAQAISAYAASPQFDPMKSHRLGIEIRDQAPTSDNGVFDFVPAGGAVQATRDIVDNDTCNACHDVLAFHGGPRSDVPYCVTCHNPSSIDGDTNNTVDMTAMIHNIHVGRDDYVIVGFRGTVYDYSNVQFTQDVRNCQTCHQESDADTPQASNWRLVANRAACGTCHFDDGTPGNGQHDFDIASGMHPGGLNFSDDSQCLDCHGPDSTVTDSDGDLLRTAEVHRIPSLEASQRFAFNIVDVRNVVTGGLLEIDYSVTDENGLPYNLNSDPAFTACADGTSRLVIDVGWTTADFTNSGSGAPNASPIGLNALGAGCGGIGTDTDGDGIYTAVSTVPLPPGLEGSIAVALEGHPGADLNGDGVIGGTLDRVAVTNAIAYFGVDAAVAVPRRNAVAIEKCGDCHKQLALHGNNRTDQPEACAICHNPNATDVLVRIAGTACEAELGLDDQPIDMKHMIHSIHAGLAGICGFRSSAYPYFDVVYPGRLNNCEGCHEPGGYYPVEPGQLLATTIDANDPTTPEDDRAISANTAVCSSCHNSALASAHMKQNGGDFDATKAADSSTISVGVETCTICHGPGRSADVAEVHGVGEFNFN